MFVLALTLFGFFRRRIVKIDRRSVLMTYIINNSWFFHIIYLLSRVKVLQHESTFRTMNVSLYPPLEPQKRDFGLPPLARNYHRDRRTLRRSNFLYIGKFRQRINA